MKISFDITVEDIVAFNVYYYDRDRGVRKQLRRARFLSPAVFILFAAVLSFQNDWDWVPFLIFGVLSLLWILLWPLYNRRRWMNKARKEVLKPENAAWLGGREMTLDGDGVSVVSGQGVETVRWGGFIGCRETDDYIFLFQTPRQALCIPKRALSQSEAESLKSLIARHIAVETPETKNKK